MKLMFTIAGVTASLSSTAAWADSYQRAIDGLMNASNRYLALTYECRDVTGMSSFRKARASTENAARATGMPTDEAVLTVERMVSRLQAKSQSQARLGIHTCVTGVSRARQDVQEWRAKLGKAQH